jgi:Saxitoxin biosynthesis operon protein SxtJ
MGIGSSAQKQMTRAAGRKFGVTVGLAFLAIAGILWWRDRETISMIAASIGGLLLAGGLIVPDRMGPVESAWMKLAHAISKVTTPVFMAIIYFIVMTPAGLLVRAFGHRPLVTPAGRSAWKERAGDHRRSDLERQF